MADSKKPGDSTAPKTRKRFKTKPGLDSAFTPALEAELAKRIDAADAVLVVDRPMSPEEVLARLRALQAHADGSKS